MSLPDAALLRAMYAQADEACAKADRAEWLVQFAEWLRNPNGAQSSLKESSHDYNH